MASSIGGFGFGLDTNALVTGLVQAEQGPIDAVKRKQSQVQSASLTVSAFTSKLSALQSAATALSTPSGFASTSASSSDAGLTPSATGAALPGAYDLTITQLARETRTWSDPQASGTAALGLAGTIAVSVGSGAAASVSVTATDTLTDIATKIGASGQRVSATVIYDGTSYRMQIRGLDPGAASAVSIAENGLSLGLSTPANVSQTAQDAVLQVDGVTVKRPTNQVAGVIPGVTLALTKASGTPVTVTVSNDETALERKLQAFVTAYNDVVTAAHTATGYGGSKASNPVLAADPSIRGTLGDLAKILSDAIPGASATLPSLASAGMGSTRDGTLKLDTVKLAKAMANDPSAVTKLFVKDPTSGSTGMMSRFAAAIDALAMKAGSRIQSRVDGLGAQAKRLSSDIDGKQRRLDAYAVTLRARFASLDAAATAYQTAGASIINYKGSLGRT